MKKKVTFPKKSKKVLPVKAGKKIVKKICKRSQLRKEDCPYRKI